MKKHRRATSRNSNNSGSTPVSPRGAQATDVLSARNAATTAAAVQSGARALPMRHHGGGQQDTDTAYFAPAPKSLGSAYCARTLGHLAMLTHMESDAGL